MKRREFIVQSATCAAGAALAGCSSLRQGRVEIRQDRSLFTTETSLPKPTGGTMPMREIGKTGIKVSQLGFGSHIRRDMISFFDERQKIIREAYDLGVNLFDVYDYEQECFQYEPMGQHLKPFINDVVISIAILPYSGRTFEEEIERDLRLFGRDYIDMVRVHGKTPESPQWEWYDKLFRLKEKGYVRAVGVPIHNEDEIEPIFENFPIDYVFFPYGFYNNVPWYEHSGDSRLYNFPERLREKGVGVVTMKAFAGDYLVAPLKKVAEKIKRDPEINFAKSALKYVISGAEPDTAMVGMYNLDHVYENVDAYFNPYMTDEERKLLADVKDIAYISRS